jgi:hypothetical protein
MRIWKWEIEENHQELVMPIGAKILSVQIQGESVQLWALVDEKVKDITRTFEVYMTGQPLPHNPGEYITTLQFNGGHVIGHLFETTNGKENPVS